MEVIDKIEMRVEKGYKEGAEHLSWLQAALARGSGCQLLARCRFVQRAATEV